MIVPILVALLRTGPAAPEFTDPEARAHFEAAARGFAEGRYDDAATELRQAYAIEPVAELLYARGQAERLGGEFAAAAEAYADYLETDPPTGQAANARMMLLYSRVRVEAAAQACTEAATLLATYVELYPDAPEVQAAATAVDQCREVAPVREPVPPPKVADRPAPPPTPRDAAPRAPWHRDIAAGVLVGSGLGVVAAGTTVALFGRNTFARGTIADSHDRAASLMDRGIVLERVGIGVAAAGAALFATGAIRWLVLATKSHRQGRARAIASAGFWRNDPIW